MNKFWKELYRLPKVKKHYPRAKRSKKDMIAFAESMGLKIYWYWTPIGHGVLKGENSIHNEYGVQDVCLNLSELEECLEEYSNSLE